MLIPFIIMKIRAKKRKKSDLNPIFSIIVSILFILLLFGYHHFNAIVINDTKNELISTKTSLKIDDKTQTYLKQWRKKYKKTSYNVMPTPRELIVKDLKKENKKITDTEIEKQITERTNSGHIIVPQAYIKNIKYADRFRFNKIPLINKIYFSIGDILGCIAALSFFIAILSVFIGLHLYCKYDSDFNN